MKFSDYAKMLYPYLGGGKNTSDFIIELTNHIMEKPHFDEDKKAEEDDEYNPLSKLAPNTLGKIYSGSRPLSKSIARKLVEHLDKGEFAKWINRLSLDTIDTLKVDLQTKNIVIGNKTTDELCADIFEEILIEYVKGKEDSSPNTSQSKEPSQPHTTTMLAEFIESVSGFDVEDFISRKPFTCIPAYCISDAIDFVGHIKYKNEHEENPDKHKPIYQDIIKFADSLLEYLSFLGKKSDTPKIDDNGFTPPHKNDSKFEKMALDHLYHLRELYDKISKYSEKYYENENNKLKAYHKKEWDKNTLKGIF